MSKFKHESCKHFTGYQNGTCKAGIEYRKQVDGDDFGWAARIPCITTSLSKEQVTCDKKELPTKEEIDAEEAESKQRTAHTLLAIKRIQDTKQAIGQISCPACANTLRFSVASNKHIHGLCSTKGCLQWMM